MAESINFPIPPASSHVHDATCTPGPNLRLSAMCEVGSHDLCAAPVVLQGEGRTWQCRCLCHQARREPAEPYAGLTWGEALGIDEGPAFYAPADDPE